MPARRRPPSNRGANSCAAARRRQRQGGQPGNPRPVQRRDGCRHSPLGGDDVRTPLEERGWKVRRRLGRGRRQRMRQLEVRGGIPSHQQLQRPNRVPVPQLHCGQPFLGHRQFRTDQRHVLGGREAFPVLDIDDLRGPGKGCHDVTGGGGLEATFHSQEIRARRPPRPLAGRRDHRPQGPARRPRPRRGQPVDDPRDQAPN